VGQPKSVALKGECPFSLLLRVELGNNLFSRDVEISNNDVFDQLRVTLAIYRLIRECRSWRTRARRLGSGVSAEKPGELEQNGEACEEWS
jgi:hypothetical protein